MVSSFDRVAVNRIYCHFWMESYCWFESVLVSFGSFCALKHTNKRIQGLQADTAVPERPKTNRFVICLCSDRRWEDIGEECMVVLIDHAFGRPQNVGMAETRVGLWWKQRPELRPCLCHKGGGRLCVGVKYCTVLYSPKQDTVHFCDSICVAVIHVVTSWILALPPRYYIRSNLSRWKYL